MKSQQSTTFKITFGMGASMNFVGGGGDSAFSGGVLSPLPSLSSRFSLCKVRNIVGLVIELWRILKLMIRELQILRILEGDHSGCAKTPVDMKTKFPFQHMLIILKHKFCFEV